MRFQPMPLLTFLSVLSVILLIFLGNWQYERFSSKMAAANAPAETVAPVLTQMMRLEVGDGPVQQVYGVIDGEPVWRRYVPVRLDGQAEIDWALAMVSITGGPTPVMLDLSGLDTAFEMTVLKRDPDSYPRGLFANADQPDAALWYTFDGANLAEAYGFDTAPAMVLEPVELSIVSSEDPSRARQAINPYAYDTPPDPLPPERHFGYAVTWWGMAIALLGVYLALHHARGRLRFRSE